MRAKRDETLARIEALPQPEDDRQRHKIENLEQAAAGYLSGATFLESVADKLAPVSLLTVVPPNLALPLRARFEKTNFGELLDYMNLLVA